MSAPIQILWRHAADTFRYNKGCKPCPKKLEHLKSLMDCIKAEDINLHKYILDFVRVQLAPMCVIGIYEDKYLTMGVFILKHGVTLPMHDHPGMHGFLKVLTGIVEISNYTLKTTGDGVIKTNEKIGAFKHEAIKLDEYSETCMLTPWDKNLHEIKCITGPAAFLDILSPPYVVNGYRKGPRPCTFFKVIESKPYIESEGIIEEVQLMALKNEPDFFSRNIRYTGPPISDS